MKRRDIINLIGGAFAWPLVAPAAWSAGSESPPKIGWLKIQGPRHSPDQLKAFGEGMGALGQIEGRDYVLVERYGEARRRGCQVSRRSSSTSASASSWRPVNRRSLRPRGSPRPCR